MPAVTSGMRAHICERPSLGVPSSCVEVATTREPLLHPGEHRAAEVGAADPRRTRVGRRHTVGHRLELALAVERVLSERGIDGEHLGVLDVAHRARLGDVMALDGEAHVDVDRPPGAGVGEVLGGRPHAGPPRRRLHRLDRRGEARHRRTGTPSASPVPTSPAASSGSGCAWPRDRGTSACPRRMLARREVAPPGRQRRGRRPVLQMRAMRVPLTVNDFLRRAELLYGDGPASSTSPTSRRRRGAR